MNIKTVILTILALAAAAAVLLFVVFPDALSGKPKPSILLITLDTTRADRLGCYGYDKPVSPNIDRIARDGVRFDLAIAQASVTPVSHASIMTGLYPYENNVRVLHGASSYRLDPKYPTLAGILRDEGWRTGAFVSAFTVSEYFGLDHGFDVFKTGIAGDIEDKLQVSEEGRASWTVHRDQRAAHEATDEAIEWLQEKDDPFFLWLHYFDPHDPTVLPPQEFLQKHCPPLNGMAQDDATRAIYDAEVAYMDMQLGRLFEYLEDSGRDENTVIIITNDHGEGLGDHDWWYHRILYQEQIRMPLIIRSPGGPQNRSVPDLVRSIDIMPTALKLAGIEPPPMTGKSLVGLMNGETETEERLAYADALIKLDNNRPRRAEEESEYARYNDLMYCVMSRSWKLIHFHFQPEESELYFIEKDPREEKNVIAEYPEKRAELFKTLEREGIMIEDLIPMTQDPETIKRLKGLGY